MLTDNGIRLQKGMTIMTLREILRDNPYKVIRGSVDTEIGKIEIDSRKIQNGDVFFALTGLGADGHNYIEKAVAMGASAIVAERECDSFGKTLIVCENSRKLLAYASANYYGNPADKMKLIGVTGTNGKTTVTHIIKTILDFKGVKTGLIGTNHYLIGNKELPSTGTTPEAMELHGIFRKMLDEGCQYVIMETSSHALALDRCLGLKFEVGVFTNLTQDHLNYHIDMENYAAAKSKLFEISRISVINSDDTWGKFMKKNSSKVFTYGIEKNADMQATDIEYSEKGVSFKWNYRNSCVPMKMAIPGKFSVYNALAGVGACAALGLGDEELFKGLLLVRGVKGRAEVVPTGEKYTVMIDYAHTPDGIENILNAVKGFVKNRIIIVFGCGGDRDRDKRPKMGKVAMRLADFSVITSDNPRTEKPEDIINDILAGIDENEEKYVAITDRTEAIKYALSMAEEGDVVLLAGKGHETYQDIMGEKIHYDEREIVKKILEI